MPRKPLTSPTTSFTGTTSSFLGLSSSSALPNPATNPDDPFYPFLLPPPDESLEDRVEREEREADARRVNDEIDEMLKAERATLRRRRKPVKVLLLGQSESGALSFSLNF